MTHPASSTARPLCGRHRLTRYQQRIHELPTAVVQHFQRALQVGIWDNGSILTPSQRQACQNALDHWQALRHSHMRAGGIMPRIGQTAG